MPRQMVQYDFSGGIDQRTDARHVLPGRLKSLVNGQFEKDGSIRKRRGFSSLAKATTAGLNIATVKHVAAYGDELVALDGTSLHTYSAGLAKWVTKDVAQPVALVPRQNVVSGVASLAFSASAQSYVSPDVVYCYGFVVASWAASYATTGRATISVLDALTGAQVFSSVSIDVATFALPPRLAVIGTKVFIVYADLVGNIWARTYDTTTFTLSGRTAIATNLRHAANANFQIATDGTNLYVVYEENTVGALTYLAVNAALATLATNTVNTGGIVGPYVIGTCVTAGETWWISYASLNGGATVEWWAVGHSPSVYTQTIAAFRVDNTIAAGAPIAIGAARLSATNAVLTLSTTQGGITAGSYVAAWRQVTTGGATSGALRKSPHAVWASKPRVVSSRTFAWAYYYSGLAPDSAQETLVLVDLLTDDVVTTALAARPVAVALPRIALRDTATFTASNTLAGFVANGSKVFTIGGWRPFSDQRALDLVAVETAPTYMSRELGSALYISGGFPALYDGTRVVEAAFLTFPEALQSATVLNGAGTMTVSSTYQYSVVATWTSAHGEVIRSAPSTPITVTTGVADDTARFYVANLPWTLMGEAGSSWVPNVTFELYRTKANGSTFFLVPRALVFDVLSGNNGPIINDPTTHSRQYEDRTPDSALDGQPIIYVTGGILSSVTPPGSQILTVHQDRLFLADGTDIWFTSKRSANTAGIIPRWNETQMLSVTEGGPITALGTCGGYLSVFKRGSIFLVAGDGPGLDGGTGQEFSSPQRVSSDVGCISQRSVAVTPLGTVFQATAGIYLLSPGGQVQCISAPIEETLAANPVVSSVTVHESLFQVRFTCSESDGTNGVVLVWDYWQTPDSPLGRWSVFTLRDSLGAVDASPVAGSCNSRGSYYWASPTGAVYQENTQSHTDDGAYVEMSFETAWIKFGGLQGFQRIWSVALLSERLSDFDLRFEYAVDYSDTYEPAVTKTVTSAMALAELQYTPRKQKGAAMRVKFTDKTPTAPGVVDSGAGPSFTGLAFEAKVLPKTNRLPSAQRS